MAPDLTGLLIYLAITLGLAVTTLVVSLALAVRVILREDRPRRLARHETRSQYWGHALLGV